MASISTQKPFAKNNDNGLGKCSFKGLALIKIHYLDSVEEFLALSSFLNS